MNKIILLILIQILLNAESYTNKAAQEIQNIMISTHKTNLINNIQNQIKKNNLIKSEYKFGENIEIIGKWNIKENKYKYDIEFKKDYSFIRDHYKNWMWKILDNGNVIVFENGFENKITFYSYTYDIFKIKDRLKNGCFLVVTKNDLDIEMCKKEGPIFTREKAPIVLEIVK